MKDKRTKTDLLRLLRQKDDELRQANRTINMISMDLQKINVRLTFSSANQPTEYIQNTIYRALSEFNLDIVDGKNNDHILNKYIAGSEGLGWSWYDTYKNGSFAWCGAFAAFCYGPALKSSVRSRTMASCYRMYRDWRNTVRCHNGQDLKVGDIVTVFNSTDPDKRAATPQGNHIVLVKELPKNGEFETYEGNAKGYGPEGNWREGVSTRKRQISTIAHVYRLLQEDFNGY
tara:strand:+ start:2259 stop:2951 length:693 start_codon:yes stop_codon:yes gene_type:complete